MNRFGAVPANLKTAEIIQNTDSAPNKHFNPFFRQRSIAIGSVYDRPDGAVLPFERCDYVIIVIPVPVGQTMGRDLGRQ